MTRSRRWPVLLAALACVATLAAGCADDGLREGTGEVDVDQPTADTTPTTGGRPLAGDAGARLVCDNPLYWGLGLEFDAGGNPVGATATLAGVSADARLAADAAVLAEQPGLTGYAEVTETRTGPMVQYDYVVGGKTVAVVTVLQGASGGYDFAEGVICEAEAAIVPPDLVAMRDALRTLRGIDYRTARCITEQGVATFGPDAWPTIAAGQSSQETKTQFDTIVEGCRP